MTLDRRIQEIAGRPLTRTSAEELSALLDAASERAADIIPSGTRNELEQATLSASAALQAIRRNHDIDRENANFLAGRLAALTDIYGYSTAATADEAIVAPLSDPAYAAVFDAVARGYSSGEDIANETGSHAAAVRPIIAELCCATLIVEFRHGHNRHYELSPVGQLVYTPHVESMIAAPPPRPF